MGEPGGGRFGSVKRLRSGPQSNQGTPAPLERTVLTDSEVGRTLTVVAEK